MKLIVHLAAACSLLLFACKKDNKPTTETSPDARVQYELTTTNRTSVLETSPSSSGSGLSTRNWVLPSITWTGGYASVSEIRLKAKARKNDDDNDDNGDDFDFEYSSPVAQKIDLFGVVSQLGMITLPQGNYKKIEFKIKFQPTANQAAFELTGNYQNDAGVLVPVVISIDQPFEIKFQLKSPERINANIDYTALNELALDLLMNGISVSALRNAVRNSNGRLHISANKNGALFKTVWNNFKVMLKVKMKKR